MTGRAVRVRAQRLPIDAAQERFLDYLTALNSGPGSGSLLLGPSLQPCVCGAPRHEHSGPARTGKCAPTGCSRYRRDVVDALLEKVIAGYHATLGDDLIESDRREHEDRPKPAAGGWGIGPSDAGGCRAAIAFRERGWGTNPQHRLHHERGDSTAPEGTVFYSRDPEDYAAARVGSLIHADALRRRENLYPWRMYGDKPGMSITIPGLDRDGRYDEFDPITGRVVDVKTAGTWKWDVVNNVGPDESQWQQLMLYGLALTRQGYVVRDVQLAYLERAGGRDVPFTRPYSEQEALDALSSLIATAGSLDDEESLPRDRQGPTLDALCRRCFARSACWQVPQAESAGRSPEGWVRLGRTPHEDAVAQVLEEYDAAREVEKEGKKGKEAAKVQLEGIPHGTYGDWKWGYSGGNAQPPAPDLESRASQLQDEMLDAIAENRPPRDPYSLPHPMVEKTSRISPVVKRLTVKERQARDAATPAHLLQPERQPQPLDQADGIVDGEVVSVVHDDAPQRALPAAAGDDDVALVVGVQ